MHRTVWKYYPILMQMKTGNLSFRSGFHSIISALHAEDIILDQMIGWEYGNIRKHYSYIINTQYNLLYCCTIYNIAVQFIIVQYNLHDLQIPVSMKAPKTISTVWTKSVHMTAVSPPTIVNIAAMASRMSTLKYSHSGEDLPIASCMNSAPANKSACNMDSTRNFRNPYRFPLKLPRL